MPVVGIENDPIANVFCGHNSTFLLTSSGTVFSFGLNTDGQLGHGDTKEHPTPIVRLSPPIPFPFPFPFFVLVLFLFL
jgi:alpha-tubulin suppressor-like RCC1 family protein